MTGAIDLDPEPITNWLLLLLAISGVITVSITWGVKVLRKREQMRKERQEELIALIKETTKPIQADANGSWSLPDLHKKFDKMETTIKKIEDRYNAVIEQEELQRVQWHARYLEDQKFHHGKLASVFVAIRKLLHIQDIEEQVREWDTITEAYLDGTIIEKYPDERNDDGVH
jgi:cellulose biosynthesis protein BcsQ